MLVLFVAVAILGKSAWVLVGLAVLFALALQRMHRFYRLYAVELFVQLLLTKSALPAGPPRWLHRTIEHQRTP